MISDASHKQVNLAEGSDLAAGHRPQHFLRLEDVRSTDVF